MPKSPRERAGKATSANTARQSASALAKSRSLATPIPARQHVLHGTGEPHDADEHAVVHSADKCVQQEAGTPRSHGRAICAPVQLRPHPQNAAGHAGNGGGHRGPALVDGRRGCAGRCPVGEKHARDAGRMI
jgi:hypothetical protein